MCKKVLNITGYFFGIFPVWMNFQMTFDTQASPRMITTNTCRRKVMKMQSVDAVTMIAAPKPARMRRKLGSRT